MKALFAVFLLFLAATAGAQNTDRDLFQQAEIRFRNGDYELALDRYQALLRDSPFSRHVPDAQFRIGVSQHRLGRYEESLRTFGRVETRFRSTRYIALVPFWKGVTHYYLSRYRDAVRDLERYLEQDGIEEIVRQALLYRALSLDALGEDPEPDVARILELADAPTDEPYATTIYMRSLMRRGARDETIVLYERLDPDLLEEGWRGRIQLYAAEAYWGAGDRQTALSLYRGLEEADPDVAVVAFQRQFIDAQDRDDRNEIDRVVRQAEIQLRGRTEILIDFWTHVGIDSYRRSRPDLAELYLSRVWNLRGQHEVGATVALYLAELAVESGEFGRAISILEEQLERDESEAERLLIRLGGILMLENRFESAAEVLSESLDRFPQGEFAGQAAYQLAFARYQLGDIEETLAVISDTDSRGMAGGFRRDMRRLEASAYRRMGNMSEAAESYRAFLVESPDDIDTRIEYAKVLFEEERYEAVTEQIAEVYARAPDLAERDRRAFLQTEYLEGLSRVGLRQYEEAIVALETLRDIEQIREVDEQGALESIYPYSLYYLGWSHYRLGEWLQAYRILSDVIAYDRDHRLAARSAYIAGWSAYSDGLYEEAEAVLSEHRLLTSSDDEIVEGRYLLSQVYRALGDTVKRGEELSAIYEEYPGSSYADEALYEHASILADAGATDQAAELYLALFNDYPESPLSFDALFRRGEVFFNVGEYEAARDAWLFYREEAAGDRLYAASLYWSGRASEELGESGAALLVWNRLINEYRDSSFRFDAMVGAAELYEQRGELRQALNLYTEMVGSYSERAGQIDAQGMADQLVLRLGGLNEQEASLLVRIEQGQRASTSEGRQAIIDLARLVIYESAAESVNRRLVLPLLREAAGQENEDPDRAAEAQFLIGEWYYQQDDDEDAAEAFLEAAAINPADRDLTAQSLYRAAESYRRRGNRGAVIREIVETLQDEFPASEWTSEAQSILEALQ